jgi:hypothetical protein
MREQQKRDINQFSVYFMVFLCIIALVAVLSGYAEPAQRDEGPAAHIFQLSIVVLVPMIGLFLGTADWSRPLLTLRPLALSIAALVLAFGALYYLEHYRNPNYVGGMVKPVSSSGRHLFRGGCGSLTARCSHCLSITSYSGRSCSPAGYSHRSSSE